MTYQSHDNESSTSNSSRKLTRIRMPEDLSGKRVLDIGCNEGFFCGEAGHRNADYVLGLDNNERALAFATERYGGDGVEFQKGTWRALPDGPFDVILWLSAMHYEPDPAPVFRRIYEILAPDGLFILECGIRTGLQKEITPVPRARDIPWYPTAPLLWGLLAEYFTIRMVAQPEVTGGDKIPRSAYHCSRLKTTVVVFRGSSKSGKSTVVRELFSSASKTLELDVWLSFLSRENEQMTPFRQWLTDNFNRDNLQPIYKGIDDNDFTDDYVGYITKGISKSDRLVLLDGCLTDLQVQALSKRLGTHFAVWDATRVL